MSTPTYSQDPDHWRVYPSTRPGVWRLLYGPRRLCRREVKAGSLADLVAACGTLGLDPATVPAWRDNQRSTLAALAGTGGAP